MANHAVAAMPALGLPALTVTAAWGCSAGRNQHSGSIGPRTGRRHGMRQPLWWSVAQIQPRPTLLDAAQPPRQVHRAAAVAEIYLFRLSRACHKGSDLAIEPPGAASVLNAVEDSAGKDLAVALTAGASSWTLTVKQDGHVLGIKEVVPTAFARPVGG